MDWEIKDEYAWILQCLLEVIGLVPKVFVTDVGSEMNAAVQLKYPLIFSIYCIWHIRQNLLLQLRFKLEELFEQFKKDFYDCHNSLEQEIFEQL